MPNPNSLLRGLALAAALLCAGADALAQSGWPNRPFRFLVGNSTGEADYLHQRECLAANPKVYAQLVNLLQPYSKFSGVAEKAVAAQATAGASSHSRLCPACGA